MKKGFTLAEVLITLAVIGVVAALTIPALVHKYQQKQYYTAFMKVYNTILNAVSLSIAQNGDPMSWNIDIDQGVTLEKYLYPFIRKVGSCEQNNCPSYDISFLSSDRKMSSSNAYFQEIEYDYDSQLGATPYNSAPLLTLPDGAFLQISFFGSPSTGIHDLHFTFDTNGTRGPNVVGRDIFLITYYHDEQWRWDFNYNPGGGLNSYNEPIMSNCDPSSNDEANGAGCAGRLILEGKMNY